jgi:crotonobetainyl-CoA:carnitine CoA-transferase CaiB-like acyl-CoA transferase
MFAAAIGRDDLLEDPRFGSVASRLENMGELTAIIADFAATVSDPEAFEEVFAANGLAVGRVRAPGELADTEWGRSRGVTVAVDDRHGGSIRVPNVPWRFSAAPDVGVEPVVRYRGEDNRAVLSEVLGYDADRIDGLEAAGVLSSRVPDTAR